MARGDHGNTPLHVAAGDCASQCACRTHGRNAAIRRAETGFACISTLGGSVRCLWCPVGRETGLEPATACLEGRNSTRLSYSRTLSSIPARGGRVYTPARMVLFYSS